jgi:Sulfotransferase domain
MPATLHTIESRSIPHPADEAKLDNFALGQGVETSPSIVISETGWSLYCLDQHAKKAVFVKTPDGYDLTATPFLRMSQYSGAERILTVDWSELEALSAQVALPKNLIFIFNIGRSGTTLVSHLLAQVPDMWSLSEPDVDFVIAANRNTNGPELTQMLVRACTRLLCRPPSGEYLDTVAIKHYSQTIYTCDYYFKAFPKAKYVFLYRDGKSWANSLHKMTQNFGLPELLDAPLKDFFWYMTSAASDPKILDDYFDNSAQHFYTEQIFGPGWALYMQEYIDRLNAGVPFLALRYNEMKLDHLGTTQKLFEHCGIAECHISNAMKAFDQDSQQGSGIGQDNKAEGFKPENYQRFAETLAKHPRLNRPDMILPDIYTPT